MWWCDERYCQTIIGYSGRGGKEKDRRDEDGVYRYDNLFVVEFVGRRNNSYRSDSSCYTFFDLLRCPNNLFFIGLLKMISVYFLILNEIFLLTESATL